MLCFTLRAIGPSMRPLLIWTLHASPLTGINSFTPPPCFVVGILFSVWKVVLSSNHSIFFHVWKINSRGFFFVLIFNCVFFPPLFHAAHLCAPIGPIDKSFHAEKSCSDPSGMSLIFGFLDFFLIYTLLTLWVWWTTLSWQINCRS